MTDDLIICFLSIDRFLYLYFRQMKVVNVYDFIISLLSYFVGHILQHLLELMSKAVSLQLW